MSNNEYAKGTITLPVAAVASFRKAVNAAANSTHEHVLAEAKRVHATIGTRSPKLYERAAEDQFLNGHSGRMDQKSLVRTFVYDVLRYAIAPKPHVPTHADVDRVIARGGNRTNEWLGDAWSMSLDGREVTIAYDGNHASDRFEAHPVSAAAVRALNATTWTRGSGGVLWYNSEYNEGPSGNSYGGGDRVSEAWGPEGERIRDADRGFSIKDGKYVSLR